MRYGWFIFIWCVSSFTWASPLSFGVVPQQSPEELAKRWVPILENLSETTGFSIEFHTASTIPEFEQRVLNGEYDLVYMNPYHYTFFHQQPGYVALAKQKDQKLQGIIVVAQENPIKSIQDLDGKSLAFPSPAAFAATIIPQALLKKEGINIESQYVSSHDSVYLNVANGFLSQVVVLNARLTMPQRPSPANSEYCGKAPALRRTLSPIIQDCTQIRCPLCKMH